MRYRMQWTKGDEIYSVQLTFDDEKSRQCFREIRESQDRRALLTQAIDADALEVTMIDEVEILVS